MTTISVGGLTFSNAGGTDANGVEWTFSGTKGWFDGAPGKGGKTDRPQQHGMFTERAWKDSRLITVEGHVHAPTRALAASARRSLAGMLAEGFHDALIVDDPDEGVLSAQVRIEGTPLVDWAGPLDIDYQLTFLAPDPLRYGAPVVTSTPFAQMLGGLAFDLFTDGTTSTGFLEFGAPGAVTGSVPVSNSGTALAWPVFRVAGPTPPEGFDLVDSATGSRLRYTGQIPTGSTLTIDSATGLVTLDGVDRRTSLTIREWFSIAPDSALSVLFSPLGGPTSAVLTVTVTPPSW